MAFSNHLIPYKTTIARTLAAAFILTLNIPAAQAQSAARPVLVVGVTVEGLSADYLELLRGKFGSDGLNRLLDDAVTITDLDFGTPLDGAAAATVIYTGAAPTVNGIAAGTFYNQDLRRSYSSFLSDPSSDIPANYSPARIIATTIADELRIDGGGMGEVHSIAPDAPIAIAGAGHAANSAHWISDTDGRWVTSSAYPESSPLIQNYNRTHSVATVLDTLAWEPVISVNDYPDLPSFRRAYPFSIRFGRGEAGRYTMFKSSPAVNQVVTDLAIEYLRTLQPGKHEAPDMLSLAYTVRPYPYGRDNDYKLETMDGYLRLDRDIARLMKAIDENGPGMDKTLFFVAGTPPTSRTRRDDEKWRLPGGEFHVKRAISLLNLYLIQKFGNGEWITGYHNGYFYINPTLVANLEVDPAVVRKETATFLRRMSGVAYAYTIDEVTSRDIHDNSEAVCRNTRLDSSGDVLVTVAPGWQIIEEAQTSTPVPLVERMASSTSPAFIMAPGINPQKITVPVDARVLAPTVTGLMRIRAPSGASIAPLRL